MKNFRTIAKVGAWILLGSILLLIGFLGRAGMLTKWNGAISPVSHATMSPAANRTPTQVPSVSPAGFVTTAPRPTTTPIPTLVKSNTPVPTARRFLPLDGCTKPDALGRIVFYHAGENFRHPDSQSSLCLMNGEGCFLRLLISQTTSAFSWSPDYRQIAIGCADGSKICILDVDATLATCPPSQKGSVCQPVILQTYAIPDVCSDSKVYSIAWSPDLTRMAIACERSLKAAGGSRSNQNLVCVFERKAPEVCQTILTDEYELWIDWSPTEDRLVVSTKRGEIFLLRPDGSDRVDLAYGLRPEWSPDGKQIAFLKPSEDEDKNSSVLPPSTPMGLTCNGCYRRRYSLLIVHSLRIWPCIVIRIAAVCPGRQMENRLPSQRKEPCMTARLCGWISKREPLPSFLNVMS